MEVITAPTLVDTERIYMRPTVFLAGSIEMGKAINWQQGIATELQDLDGVLLDPRRADWDPAWEQSIDNPYFREQVEWELEGLDIHSTIQFFHFQPDTMSPITLMELGLIARSLSLATIVHCPKGFWRKGNVDILCAKYNIPVYTDWNEALGRLRWAVTQQNAVRDDS